MMASVIVFVMANLMKIIGHSKLVKAGTAEGQGKNC